MLFRSPSQLAFDAVLLDQFTAAEEVIMALRTIRKEKNIPFKESIELLIRKNNDEKADTLFDNVVAKICNISRLEYVEDKVSNASSFIVKSTEFYVPMKAGADNSAEIAKLEEQLKYTQGFLESVMKKLSNERFVANAKPEVVEVERTKQADAESRIRVLTEQLEMLRG